MFDDKLHGLVGARISNGDIGGRSDVVGANDAAPQIAGHLAEGPLGRRQADALDPAATAADAQGVEPREAQGQVRAALGGDEGVDLIDDHRFDGPERLPRLAREQQPQ